MAASVASSWGPGFVVGVRRPVSFAGRAKAVRALDRMRVEMGPTPVRAPAQARMTEFARVPLAPARTAPPMRRRFEADAPTERPAVSPRARRVDRPAPGRVRAHRRVRPVRGRAVSARASAPARLRLTRRGRVLAFVLVAVAVYAAFGLGRASAGATPVPAHASTVVVGSGDSLWSIALKAFPNADPRDVVGRLESLNHLTGGQVMVGQRLRLR